jgi:hypothetical protein
MVSASPIGSMTPTNNRRWGPTRNHRFTRPMPSGLGLSSSIASPLRRPCSMSWAATPEALVMVAQARSNWSAVGLAGSHASPGATFGARSSAKARTAWAVHAKRRCWPTRASRLPVPACSCRLGLGGIDPPGTPVIFAQNATLRESRAPSPTCLARSTARGRRRRKRTGVPFASGLSLEVPSFCELFAMRGFDLPERAERLTPTRRRRRSRRLRAPSARRGRSREGRRSRVLPGRSEVVARPRNSMVAVGGRQHCSEGDAGEVAPAARRSNAGEDEPQALGVSIEPLPADSMPNAQQRTPARAEPVDLPQMVALADAGGDLGMSSHALVQATRRGKFAAVVQVGRRWFARLHEVRSWLGGAPGCYVAAWSHRPAPPKTASRAARPASSCGWRGPRVGRRGTNRHTRPSATLPS